MSRNSQNISVSDKVLSMARKLKAMAERGEGGEKRNAILKYAAHLKKHGLEDYQIDPSNHVRKFQISDPDSQIILFNIILSVNPYSTYYVAKNNIVVVELDDEDFKEVSEKSDYFIRLFKVEKELLYMAFAKKHNYYFKPDARASKKWREKYAESSDLKDAQENMAKAASLYESKMAAAPQTASAAISLKDEVSIQAFNGNRVNEMAEILLEANYKKVNRTIL